MIRFVGRFLLFGIILYAFPLGAQETDSELAAQWMQRTGEIITPSAQRQLARLRAGKFRVEAGGNGFSPSDVFRIEQAIGKSTLRKATSGQQAGTWVLTEEGGSGTKVLMGRPQKEFVDSLYSHTSMSNYLERFSTIRLEVIPVPPHDYNVVINSDDCPPTVKGVYKVPAGFVAVTVTRRGKKPCEWNGQLGQGKEHQLRCRL